MKFIVFFMISILLSECLYAIRKSKYIRNLKQSITPSMDKIIKSLKKTNQLKSSEIEEIVSSIDRGDFLRSKNEIPSLEPIYIGYGATLSKPIVHIFAMEKALEKFPRDSKIKILDIGSGSGIL